MNSAVPVKWLRRRSSEEQSAGGAFSPSDFVPALKTRLLILQPTPFCNISCDYCYLPNRASTVRMPLEIVRQAAERLVQDDLLGDELTVVWHAGEPLTVQTRFYEEAIDAIGDIIGNRCTVTHSIQTNATLINREWCEFFKCHAIRVGVSVDGPAELHNLHRRTRTGAGTHGKVMRGIQWLRDYEIPFHAIAVVTADTLQKADAFYDFFVEQGVSELGCNFDEEEGTNRASSLSGKEEAFGEFLRYLLKRSLDSCAVKLRIRQLNMAFQVIAHAAPTYRWAGNVWPENDQVMPFSLISIAHNGDFSTFSPELVGQTAPEFDDFVLGNVMFAGFLDAAHGHTFQRLWGAIAKGIRKCERECAYFGYCGGGAPANKYYENGDLGSGETLYCRTMVKRPFDAVLARLESDYNIPGASK